MSERDKRTIRKLGKGNAFGPRKIGAISSSMRAHMYKLAPRDFQLVAFVNSHRQEFPSRLGRFISFRVRTEKDNIMTIIILIIPLNKIFINGTMLK